MTRVFDDIVASLNELKDHAEGKDTEDEKMLKAGIPLEKVMEEYDIKPKDLKGWEDVEIE